MKFFLLTILFALAYAGPIEDRNDVVNYLIRFGYLEEVQPRNRQSVSQAILKLQKRAHIPESGIVDQATIEFTKKPRCGVPDFVNGQTRNNIIGAWNKRNITYYIGEGTADLTEEQYAETVRLAFDTWSQHIDFTFNRVLDVQNADIDIYFGPNDHGCGYPFGDPIVLAHAFYPPNGDVHFDNDERWDLGGNDGKYDFFSVVLHELGHSLGLDHSDVLGAVMYEAYSVWTQLSDDDIDRIQHLYPTSCNVLNDGR